MENTLPLHLSHVQKSATIINRSHALFHSIALMALIYYRASFLSQNTKTRDSPILPWLLVFSSELIVSFIWFLGQAFRWRPVSRTVFPERLPEDKELPAIDVFICTADPSKEPTVEVMNTVISAMALDYPPDKLYVYLSDDGGSFVTLHAMHEAWSFAKWWLPFCRRFGIETRSPEAYFLAEEGIDENSWSSSEFMAEKEKVKEKYENFKKCVMRIRENASLVINRDHSPVVEVINDKSIDEVGPEKAKMPLLVYVSREKRPSHPHHFKAGALNVLIQLQGMDGLLGPGLCGTGFYLKREALFGTPMKEDVDIMDLKQSFGPSNEFIKSFGRHYKPNHGDYSSEILLKETQFLASCAYENQTEWGKEVGFLYFSVGEDYFTALINLHCKGWNSVYCVPARPAFLGAATTNLNDVLVQSTRWMSGLVEVCISRFCPLIYGPQRMSPFQSMCYGEFALRPFYFLPLLCFATIPQLCLLNGIPLYPEVSNWYFFVFTFIFLSSHLKHVQEVLSSGGSIISWRNEQRMWMIKAVTCDLHGSLDAIMKKMGMREASFLPTNKVVDDEQLKRYQMGKFDFQASTVLLAPMVTLVILNLISFIGGVTRAVVTRSFSLMFIQVVLSFFIVTMNFPIIEGMVPRKDKGRVPSSVSILSAIISVVFLSFGSVILMY